LRSTLILVCALLAGCSSRATTTGNYVARGAAGLPKPTMVVVEDFSVNPSAVRVDQGIGGVLRRDVSGTSSADSQATDADGVRFGITDGLTRAIGGMGLPVQQATAQSPAGPYVVVRGQVLGINEGNRTRRTAFGFGAGKSSVRAAAQVIYIAPGAEPQLLQTYEGSVDSGHMPGLAAGAASAAGGNAAAAAANGGMQVTNAGRADVSAEAKRLGTRMAVNIGGLFAEQGWIPQSAVPRPALR
jgi:hypothetical protein